MLNSNLFGLLMTISREIKHSDNSANLTTVSANEVAQNSIFEIGVIYIAWVL